jgi:DNA repair protein RecN (Recombination protein N)
MLAALRIQNFALIDSVDLHFQKGYTVLTGETGSGKSILLGALNLILGERADFSVIGPESDKAIVEAEFNVGQFQLASFFVKNDIDCFHPTIIRREITNQGRSRAFINDTPVQLGVLKELTERLVHIHSQHHSIELKNPSFQIELLDNLADVEEQRILFSTDFKKWNEAKKEIIFLQGKLADFLQKRDYDRFQLDELDELQLEKHQYAELEHELSRNENIDDLRFNLDYLVSAVESEEGASIILRKLKIQLDKTKGKDLLTDELSQRVVSVLIELEDIAKEAESYRDSIEIDPARLNELTVLVDQYNRVSRKHNASSQDQLEALRVKLSTEMDESADLEQCIFVKEKNLQQLKTILDQRALKLHEMRISAAKSSEWAVKEILAELKMPDSEFLFEFVKREELNSFGCTDVKIIFSPNKGIAPVNIEKAASGGELSRLMLALQNLVSEKKQLPTIIFDEIDTGVSGDVAQKMGTLLKKMGTHLQLIAITHLPQVAGKADFQFKVMKSQDDQRTRTFVQPLSSAERIEEIARLMSGEEINAAALENAKALMS